MQSISSIEEKQSETRQTQWDLLVPQLTCEEGDAGTSASSLPNLTPPIEHILNSMRLRVNVPVLSENTYWTWPRSWFKLDVRALAGVSDSEEATAKVK